MQPGQTDYRTTRTDNTQNRQNVRRERDADSAEYAAYFASQEFRERSYGHAGAVLALMGRKDGAA